jgi:hypothetical protein
MQLLVETVDVSRYKADPSNPPHLMIAREVASQVGSALSATSKSYKGQWHVVAAPIDRKHKVPEWSLVKAAEALVRVPLFEYTIERTMAGMLAAGIQLGAVAIDNLPTSNTVDKMRLALGDVADDKEDSSTYRVWIGLAFRTEN